MRLGFKYWVSLLLLLLLMPLGVHAAEQLSSEQITLTKQTENKLIVINELVAHQLISPGEAATATRFYCERASTALGRSVNADDIRNLSASGQSQAGFGIFLNTVIVLAGIAFLLSAVALALYYLRDFLASLPLSFYEGLAYFVTVALLVMAYFVKPFYLWFLYLQPLWLVVPAALGFAGCVNLSYYLHWRKDKDRKSEEKVRVGPGFTFPTVIAGLCTLVWGAIAILFHQGFPDAGVPHFVAFIAIMALQGFLGFSTVTTPGCIALGWDHRQQVPKSTLSSLLILAAYLVANTTGMTLPDSVKLFDTGCIFMGAFVYYLGLLVMSSKWYCNVYQMKTDADKDRAHQRYWIMQLLTTLSGFAALYLGSSYGISALLGIGGTFFSIYLLEKYYEIPWKGVGWAWSLLGIAVALYFFVGFAGQHPQFFLWGMHV